MVRCLSTREVSLSDLVAKLYFLRQRLRHGDPIERDTFLREVFLHAFTTQSVCERDECIVAEAIVRRDAMI